MGLISNFHVYPTVVNYLHTEGVSSAYTSGCRGTPLPQMLISFYFANYLINLIFIITW